MTKKTLLISSLMPFGFGLFPILVIFTHNITQLSLSRLWVPVVYSLLFVLVSLAVNYAWVKQLVKASIFTAIWVVLFFSYGYLYLKLGDSFLIHFLPISLNKFLLLSYGFGLALLAIYLKSARQNLNQLLNFLAVISLSLIIMNLLTIIPFEIRRYFANQKLAAYLSQNEEHVFFKETDFKPDIYYIIFDRYARQDVLKDFFEFDNSQQLEFLQTQGFLVADQSYLNYPNTFLSLSSSLNMSYLDFLPQTLGQNQTDRMPVFKQLIENNRVSQLLKSLNYRYVLMGSFWDPTKNSQSADENDNLFADFDEFQLFIYERTLLNVLRGLVENRQLYTGAERLNKMSLNFDYRLSKITGYQNSSQPVFVLAHFLMPHEPNIRSAECEPLTFDQIRAQSPEEGYLKETQCANLMMRTLVEKIKARSGRPAVIIFQSDEGPYLPTKYFNQGDRLVPDDNKSHLIHSAIFNAIYLPDKNQPSQVADYQKLGLNYQSSPVNTFRSIFNYYFAADLPLLPDKSYFLKQEKYPYQFVDQTLELNSDEKNN